MSDENELPPPTMPEGIKISLSNFAREEDAQLVGHTLHSTLALISRAIDLSRLDGVTVDYNYDAALAELDRGFGASRPLERSQTAEITGVAMAPAVIRDGVVKAHLVFHGAVIEGLLDPPDSTAFGEALYLVAHECGHVQDLKLRDEAFPGTICRKTIDSFVEQLEQQAIESFWQEYAACRASALFGPGQLQHYETSFVAIEAKALERADAAAAHYEQGGEGELVEAVGKAMTEPLRMAAYMFGHLDGRDETIDEAPRARDALETSPIAHLIDRLVDELRQLWERRGMWESHDEFRPLGTIAVDAILAGGVYMRPLPDGGAWIAPIDRRQGLPVLA